MKYLLDVNALIALGVWEHALHERVSQWVAALDAPLLLTSSITELGFVRILTQANAYGFTVDAAKALLAGLKASQRFHFELVADEVGAARLPGWVKTAGQTTDGHLIELAREHGAELATFDGRISGAFVIP